MNKKVSNKMNSNKVKFIVCNPSIIELNIANIANTRTQGGQLTRSNLSDLRRVWGSRVILGLTPTGDLWLAEPGERQNKQDTCGQRKHD